MKRMNYIILCTNYNKANYLLNELAKVCDIEKDYSLQFYNHKNNIIILYDGIGFNKFDFVPLNDLNKMKLLSYENTFIMNENDFRRMWLLNYDFDYKFDKMWNKIFDIKIDCNNCRWLNLTENEQRKLNDFMPHTCIKYLSQVFHNSQNNDAYYLYPCEECVNNFYLDFERREERV